MPPTYLQPAPDYLAQYNAARSRSEAEMNQRAAYASLLPNSLVDTRPSCNRRFLLRGKYPTMGEYLFSAPSGNRKALRKRRDAEAGLPQDPAYRAPEAPRSCRNFRQASRKTCETSWSRSLLGRDTSSAPSSGCQPTSLRVFSSSPMLKTKGQRTRKLVREEHVGHDRQDLPEPARTGHEEGADQQLQCSGGD